MADQQLQYSDTGNVAYGGGGYDQYAAPYSDDDIVNLDGIAPSTVAMFILFGSVMIATIGLGARAWLSGDKRGKKSFSVPFIFICNWMYNFNS